VDGPQFDQVLRAIATSRRTVIGGAVATIAGVSGWTEIRAGKRKRRKCKSPKVKCGKKCLPAGSCCNDNDCGMCQTCNGTTCIVAPSGTACGVGGSCNGTVCIEEGAFGCTLAQDYCGGDARTACPRSTTPGAICITNEAGKPQCVVGDCIFGDTSQACEAAFGVGAQLKGFCSPCALGGPGDPRNGCFRQVTR
jgi:hypothetical protein